MNHKKISEHEISAREEFLFKYGLSKNCINKIKETNYRLVRIGEAKERLDNLKELGFKNLSKLLILNPRVLFRTKKSVKVRFFMVWSYAQSLGEDKNIFYLFMMNRQLWSASLKKLSVVIYIAKEKRATSNFGRLCSMLTLALEDILLVYFQNKEFSFPCIYSEVKRRVSKAGLTKELKMRCLQKIGDKDLLNLL